MASLTCNVCEFRHRKLKLAHFLKFKRSKLDPKMTRDYSEMFLTFWLQIAKNLIKWILIHCISWFNQINNHNAYPFYLTKILISLSLLWFDASTISVFESILGCSVNLPSLILGFTGLSKFNCFAWLLLLNTFRPIFI